MHGTVVWEDLSVPTTVCQAANPSPPFLEREILGGGELERWRRWQYSKGGEAIDLVI